MLNRWTYANHVFCLQRVHDIEYDKKDYSHICFYIGESPIRLAIAEYLLVHSIFKRACLPLKLIAIT